MVETFVKDDRVKQQSKDLLSFFVMHPETKDMTKEICVKAFLNDEVLQALGK